MPTDTAHRTAARNFTLRAIAWSVGLFVLLRLSWTEAHLVLPLTRMQAGLAVIIFGTPTLPVEVSLACSGADALGLCVGTVLAYPVRWRARMVGVGAGIALVLGLNVLRIGTLGLVVASPTWFNALHVYVWPGALTLAIAGYAFAWMRLADRQPAVASPPRLSRRFVVLTAVFLVMFSAASPFYLENATVLALAGFIARAAAATLAIFGVDAHATANVMWTSRGGFLVTQECISTPLIPVYLAAVCSYSTTSRRVAIGVLAAIPLFTALGIARLLVVALPDIVASPIFLVHAFYQLVLGGVVVFAAALWRRGGRAAPAYTLAGVIVGILFVRVLGPAYARLVTAATGAPLDDPQGAIAFLPAFQIGLYLALWVAAFVAAGWRRFVAGFALLELTQIAGLLALQALTTHSWLIAGVRDVRGWAVAGPLFIAVAVVNGAKPRH